MTTEPKFACLCLTYLRPHLIGRAVQSFLLQDYPADRCELIVLDDAGQYQNQEHHATKPWRVISVPRRFLTVGEKRNASAALASPDVDAYCVWDDDDVYLPWTLRSHALALAQAEWSRPSRVWRLTRRRMHTQRSAGVYHAAWAFTRELFMRAGGYPARQGGHDRAFKARLRQAKAQAADPIALGADPFFVYGWAGTRSYHLTHLNSEERFRQLPERYPVAERPARIRPRWPIQYDQIAREALLAEKKDPP